MLVDEARALLGRLARLRPFALHETMVTAATLSMPAQVAIESYLIAGRRDLRRRTMGFIRWLQDGAEGASPAEMQRRFTIVRLQFNNVLSQFDLFADAITQRSEHDLGVYLAGLDVVSADGLRIPGGVIEPPPVVCYVDRGPGAAIRRARTRMPGGGENPAAIIRVPRERMVGHGIASSLIHEVGHQVAALLDLVPSLRQEIQKRGAGKPERDREAWGFWDRWISEIVADFWSVSRVGLASTLGLIGVVSLPRAFVFRISTDDPHPTPWMRVMLSASIGNALYQHPQWDEVKQVWSELYPLEGFKGPGRELFDGLLRNMDEFVQLLLDHRPGKLRGASLGEIARLPDRTPTALDALGKRWGNDPVQMRSSSPVLVFAVLGQSRARGRLTPERESKILRELLAYWALRSTLMSNVNRVAGQSLPQFKDRQRKPAAAAVV